MVIAVSALACILQDILHEGLGHGVTAWLSGARQVTMSTVALQSDIETRWVSANGTLVNLFFAGIFWLLLLKPQRYKPVTRYFLVLAMAGNLFTGTGYFFFSGVTNFGDWAAVIRGLRAALDVATGARCGWCGDVLRVGVAGSRTAEAIPRKQPWFAAASQFVLDAVLHGWNFSRVRRLVEPRRIILRNRVGAAVNLGCECRPVEPAKHDAQNER